jgi:hypothetical protein
VRRPTSASRSQMTFDSVALRSTEPSPRKIGTVVKPGHLPDTSTMRLDTETGLPERGIELGRSHLRFVKAHGARLTRQFACPISPLAVKGAVRWA